MKLSAPVYRLKRRTRLLARQENIAYLEALDHRRSNPEPTAQLAALRRCAEQRGLIFVLVSQIRRSFDAGARRMTELADVRLMNPADLAPFTKACFLENGELRLDTMT